jgi:hypothetical protein
MEECRYIVGLVSNLGFKWRRVDSFTLLATLPSGKVPSVPIKKGDEI